jgi:3-hydroxyacyl-[acyl-carrier-protein] dehydratase
MRWCWIDRFLEFESGRRAKAVKQITLAEDELRDHFSKYPVMPSSLVIEGMGQTAMFLAWEAIQSAQMILLAKVPTAQFYVQALPGDTLIYTVTLDSIRDDGVSVHATSHRNDQLHAEAELLFTRLGDPRTSGHSPAAHELAELMCALGAFAIGRAADGTPLRLPAILSNPDSTR